MIGIIIMGVVLLAFAYGIYRKYCQVYVDEGSRFNYLVATYLAIVDASKVIEDDELALKEETEIVQNGVRAVYNPDNPIAFFEQLDFLYLEALEAYDHIKNKELFFQDEDWRRVSTSYRALESIKQRVRLKRWQTCGLAKQSGF